MNSLTIIDRGGKRVRAICRECRKVHGVAGCPNAIPQLVEDEWGPADYGREGAPRNEFIAQIIAAKRSVGAKW